MLLDCPYCGHELKISHSSTATAVRCPVCASKIPISSGAGAAAFEDSPATGVRDGGPGVTTVPARGAGTARLARYGTCALAVGCLLLAGWIVSRSAWNDTREAYPLWDFQYPPHIGLAFSSALTPSGLSNSASVPNLTAIASIKYQKREKQEEMLARAAAEARKTAMDEQLKQNKAYLEIQRQTLDFNKRTAEQARLQAKQDQNAREFDAKMMQIVESQQVLFAERRELMDKIEDLNRQFVSAVSRLQRYNAMASPFFNLNPAATYARYGSAFPQIAPWNAGMLDINNLPPVIRLSEASRRYGCIVGGRAQYATEAAGIRSQLMAKWMQMKRLYERASLLKKKCDDLEKTRPPGAVVRPLDPV